MQSSRKTSVGGSNSSNDLYPNCDASIWLRSCEKEILFPIEGKQIGTPTFPSTSTRIVANCTVPKWLNGSLIRNGPGSLKVGTKEFQHLFDSSALLHRFHIADGKVTYQCKFLQSDAYKKYWATDRIVFTEFGTRSVPDPCKTILQRISAFFSSNDTVSDNAMISVYPFGDELYAFTEIPAIHRIDVDTLQTLGKVDVSKHVSIVNHTAHPHIMSDGTVYNVGMTMTVTGPFHNIVCFPPKSKNDPNERSMFDRASIVCGIPARWSLHPSYMHSFGITDNYFIIIEQPLTVSLPGILKCKFGGSTIRNCMKWFQGEPTIINVICRKTGTVKKFTTETFFFLHIINQYETTDEHIIIDVCCYKDPSMLDCMYIEALKNIQQNPDYAKMFKGRPLRFKLPLFCDNEHAIAEQLCDLGCETPRINNEKYLGKNYNYFYAISSDVDAENPGTIIKVCVKSKTALTWCEYNCYPSEPIFIPIPNATDEDDGIVVSALIWGKNEETKVGMLILNAKTMVEVARCTFDTSTVIPKCLHGWFLPSK